MKIANMERGCMSCAVLRGLARSCAVEVGPGDRYGHSAFLRLEKEWTVNCQ